MGIKSMSLSLGIAAVCTGLTATTASAYDNARLSTEDWYRDTDYCYDTCVIRDSRDLDTTVFKKDPGGKALRMHVYEGSKTVAQVEFHPYDEVLWVYDGANDGDTIFVRLKWNEDNDTEDAATYWAPGTSATIDSNRIELDDDDDIEEGTFVRIRLYDDKALTDPITDWTGWSDVQA